MNDEKNIFIFDKNKCVGCSACAVACINQNGFQSPEKWRNISESHAAHSPGIPLYYLSLACNHCDDSPCLYNCPANAYHKDQKTGAVIHDENKCIGCKYCTWACPFDAPKYYYNEGVIHKCTFCYERIDDGLKPACANLCPTGALDFQKTKFTSEESAVSSPVPVNVGANIKIVELRKKEAPLIDPGLFKMTHNYIDKKPDQKITAVKEIPLLLFTFVISVLTALFSSGITDNFTFYGKTGIFLTAVFASGLSLLHLGRKERAWRSVINLKKSWLSREIAAYSVWMGALFLDFFVLSLPLILKISVSLLLVVAVDMLYTRAMWKWKTSFHPGNTFLISLNILTLLLGLPYLLVIILILRSVLLISHSGSYSHRLAVGLLILAAPFLLTIAGINVTLLVVICILVELYFRIMFYNNLRIPDLRSELR